MNDPRNLEERLAEARRATPVPALPDGWKTGVMQDIHAEVAADSSYFESAVRRTAIAAAVLVLVAIAISLGAGVGTTNELYVLLRSAPESLLELAWVL